jgi:hypothetical protein
MNTHRTLVVIAAAVVVFTSMPLLSSSLSAPRAVGLPEAVASPTIVVKPVQAVDISKNASRAPQAVSPRGPVKEAFPLAPVALTRFRLGKVASTPVSVATPMAQRSR